MEDQNPVETAFGIGAAMAEASLVGATPYTALPEGFTVENLESMLPQPTRKRGLVHLRDAASFIAYVNDQKTPATKIYGTISTPGFKAIFNDHATEPGWADHIAMFDCPLSLEWKTWTKASGTRMTQEAFAQFIEDNLPNIAKPPAAEMLEVSRTLEARKKVTFASAIRLSNGQNELSYNEEVSGTTAKGKFMIPEVFTIGIPVFEGGTQYAIDARLRYRIENARLQMWFDLIRPHDILKDAVTGKTGLWEAISKGTSVPMFHGSK
jgi:uncharacterized protein YfdQ (DUF2303 family)